MGSILTSGIFFLISTFTFLNIQPNSTLETGTVLSVHITVSPSPTSTPTLTPTPRPKADWPLADTPTPLPPTSTPVPALIPHSGEQLEQWFTTYSQMYGNDRELLKKIAWCESHFHASSTNGPYGGMFQFSEGAWRGARNRMGQDENIDLRFHAEESIKTAAFKLSKDGSDAWLNCAK